MKNKIIKLLSLLMAVCLVLSFAACKKQSADAPKDKPAQTQPAGGEPVNEAEIIPDSDASVKNETTVTEATKQKEEVQAKYADAEIYEKQGTKYAKTEDGEEVELTGDNMQELMAEYTKVQGTGTDKEKDLLDKIQVILDNVDRLK